MTSTPPAVFEKTVELPVDRADLWPLISDTDRFNRSEGIPPVEFSALNNNPLGALKAQMRLVGVPVASWTEEPFEWLENRYWTVRRRFSGGLIKEYHVRCALEEISAGNTKVTINLKVWGRGPIGRMAVKPIASIMLGRFVSRYRHFADSLTTPSIHPYERKSGRGNSNERTIDDSFAAAGIRADHAARLRRFIAQAYDEELVEIRPFELAAQWGFERIELLESFLELTLCGVFEMRWEPICPHCRGAKGGVSSLDQLGPDAYCDACDLRFDIDFDNRLEARFNIHPSVRKPPAGLYCVGSPARTPHVVARIIVRADEELDVDLDIPPGEYALRCRAFPEPGVLRRGKDVVNAARLELQDRFVPQEVLLNDRRPTVFISNSSGEDVVISVERNEWANTAATAAIVTSLQKFRAQFSAEVLAPGVQVGVKSLTVFFSDLKASTRMYQQIGDAPAYSFVRQHFDFLAKCIERHHGSLVKTIGDAVMAVFSTPQDALIASTEIQKHVRDFNEKFDMDEPAKIKIGLHQGPLLVVNANGVLDYFGTTVNIAARAQGRSLGDDIVITADMINRHDLRETLDQISPIREEFSEELKGISGQYNLVRLWPLRRTTPEVSS